MYRSSLKEIGNDVFYLIKEHFFEIVSVNLSTEADEPFELLLKNDKRKLKINFYSGYPDLIYPVLYYSYFSQKPDLDPEILKGKTLKIDFKMIESNLEIENISFYKNRIKEEFPKQYRELVSFSKSNIDWFLQGLSKHFGLNRELFEFIKRDKK